MKSILFFILVFASFDVFSQSRFEIDSAFRKENEFELTNLRFEFDKAVLKKESFPLLDSVAVFMLMSDSSVFEIQNHRDSRGSNYYSTNITDKRARTVHDYLVSKGLPEFRLIAKGYGETQPIYTDAQIAQLKTKEEQEAAHQKNRRTVIVQVR